MHVWCPHKLASESGTSECRGHMSVVSDPARLWVYECGDPTILCVRERGDPVMLWVVTPQSCGLISVVKPALLWVYGTGECPLRFTKPTS